MTLIDVPGQTPSSGAAPGHLSRDQRTRGERLPARSRKSPRWWPPKIGCFQSSSWPLPPWLIRKGPFSPLSWLLSCCLLSQARHLPDEPENKALPPW